MDASSYVAILQAELRAVAARLVMPEYMLTADASNNNYASSLVAEAPAVKNFERLQSFYARQFGDGCYTGPTTAGVLWRVLAIAANWGLIPKEVLDECELQAEGPSLVVRDKAKETARARQLADAGILSPPTWAKWEGLDHEQELRQGAATKKKEGGPADANPFGQTQGESNPTDQWAGLWRDLSEACVPNRMGKGHHDDQTGYPCNPQSTGLIEPDGSRGKRPGDKQRRQALQSLIAHGQRLASQGKDAASRVGSAVWSRVPEPAQKVLTRVYHVAKAIEHKAMLGFTKGMELAVEAARQRGLDQKHVDRVGRVLAVTDLTLAWTVNMPVAYAATGSKAAGKLASWVPVASLAYIGYSFGRNPFATVRAAREVLRRKETHEALLEGEQFSHDDLGHLLDWFGKVKDPDWAEAVLCVALDQTGDLGSALELAERAVASQPTHPHESDEWWNLGDGGDDPLARGDASEGWNLFEDTSAGGFTGVITDALGRKQYYDNGKHIKGPTEDQKRRIEAAGKTHFLQHSHTDHKGRQAVGRIARGEYTLGKGQALSAERGNAFLGDGGKLKVESSAVKAVEYDPKKETLTVHWKDGTHYRYQDVTRHEAESFLHADSKGEWVNRNLKGVGFKDAAGSGRANLSRPHPFEKVSSKPKAQESKPVVAATAIAGRTGALNQNVAEGNQVLAAYALGKDFSNLPGNWPMDVQRFSGKHVVEGLECKTLLESKNGSVHMDPAAHARKEYWANGYLLIPARDYDPSRHGKSIGREQLAAERGGTVDYHVARDPLAAPDVGPSNPRLVHMCVVDHRDEWSEVLKGNAKAADERGWGRRQVYYGRGFGSVQIGQDGKPPLVCCDNPDAYRHLMTLKDDEVQRIAEQYQFGAKAYPSGADVPHRGKGLPVRDQAQHHHTDMLRWQGKTIRAKVRMWNAVERETRTEGRLKVVKEKLKQLGTPTNQKERERRQRLEYAAGRAENALKHGIPKSLERARAYHGEYAAKLERGRKKWHNIHQGLKDNHPLKGVHF